MIANIIARGLLKQNFKPLLINGQFVKNVIRPSTSGISALSVTNLTPSKKVVAPILPQLRNRVYEKPMRWYIIPDQWFQAFYDKTGVTGPYVLALGLANFMLSKEFVIITVDCLVTYANLVVFLYGSHMTMAYLEPQIIKWHEEDDEMCRTVTKRLIGGKEDSLKEDELTIASAKSENMYFDVQRENVSLQIEAAYRQRLVDVHQKVKNQLDYQLDMNNMRARLEHKHMVSWIINKVNESITPNEQANALKRCFVDLKAIAARA